MSRLTSQTGLDRPEVARKDMHYQFMIDSERRRTVSCPLCRGAAAARSSLLAEAAAEVMMATSDKHREEAETEPTVSTGI